VVRHSSEPVAGVVTLNLTELWRIGGEAEEEIFFGVISQALSDADQNVYLLDVQLAEVLVLSATGEYLRTLSGEGDGPGEIRRPGGMQWLPDGSLGLIRTMPGQVVRVDRNGIPQSSLIPGGDDPTAGGRIAVRDLLCRDGWIVMSGARMERTAEGRSQENFVAAFGADGRELFRYLQMPVVQDFRNPIWIERERYTVHDGRWALGPQGRVYAALDRDSYAITVYDSTGVPELVITRDEKPRRRTKQEKDRIAANARLGGRRAPQNFPVEVAATDPAIRSMTVDAAGRLWVLASGGTQNQPPGIMCSYDLFAPDGQYGQRVQVACPGDGRQDRLEFLGDGRAILITGLTSALQVMRGRVGNQEEVFPTEDIPMEVICYRFDPLPSP
jgi:hypothetical protein